MPENKALEETETEICQVGVVVKDLDKTKDNFVGGGGLAYMATDKIGGIIMEVIQRPPDYDPEKGVRYE